MPDKQQRLKKKKLSRKDILEVEILLETKNYTSRYRNIELRFQLLKSQPHISQRGRAVVKCWAFCVRLRGKPQKTAHRPSFVFAQRLPSSPAPQLTQVVLSTPGHLTSDYARWRDLALSYDTVGQTLFWEQWGNPWRESNNLARFTKEFVNLSHTPRSFVFIVFKICSN